MSATPKPIPAWQTISGLVPERELAMSDVERDSAIRTLLKTVCDAARAELNRPVPEGERTAFWEPIERVCFRLQIAKTKLSKYSKELTGMAAHEISDKIMAERLPELIEKWVAPMLADFPERMRKAASQFRPNKESFLIAWKRQAVEAIRAAREGRASVRWTDALKFASIPRLRRACQHAHSCSIEELEERIIHQLVQKMYEPLAAEIQASLANVPEWIQNSDRIFSTGITTEDWWATFGRWPADEKEAYEMCQQRPNKQA